MNFLILLRMALFILIAGLWYGGFWLVAGAVTLLYYFKYIGYEIIIIGWFLDMQFMTGIVPWYTIAFAVVFLVVEWCKSRLLAYTT
ncbi:MAG: hypothetical protein ACK42D_00020 [Candidatus Paceibacteria bacterium]